MVKKLHLSYHSNAIKYPAFNIMIRITAGFAHVSLKETNNWVILL